MSTISASSTSQLYAQRPPPHHAGSEKTHLSSAISSQVASGTISSTDATALTSALDSIDSSLSASGTSSASSSSSASGTRLDPSKIKDRVDGLIANQVSGGTLTSDQATALKSLFASNGPGSTNSGNADGVSGAGGPPPGSPQGPPPGPPPGGSASDTSSDGASSSTTSTATTHSSTSDLLAKFIRQLQTSQTGAAGYGSSKTGGTSQASALLFDFQS